MSAAKSPRLLVRVSACAGVAVGLGWAVAEADARVLRIDTLALAGCVTVANLLAVRYRGRLWVSASFTFSMLALARLGPAAAFAVVAVAEAATWALERYRPTAAAINLFGSGVPNLAAGTVLAALGGSSANLHGTAALATTGALALALNFIIVGTLTGIPADGPLRLMLPDPRPLVAPLCWNLALTVALVLVTLRSGALLTAVLFGLTAAGFVHMLRIGASDRLGHEREARFSSDLLEGLVGTLKQRPPADVRHAKAVARYARDIALASGHDEAEAQEAYIAGILHDIGLMAVPHPAAASARELTRDDWHQIRDHPDLGANMLRALGRVSEAVHTHHERIDGRGYPRGLAGSAIPKLGRIVAVAEVYATLTGSRGTSSFQALHELRRVAGTQLDGRYVEALATALAGKPLGYRQASDLDVDTELWPPAGARPAPVPGAPT